MKTMTRNVLMVIALAVGVQGLASAATGTVAPTAAPATVALDRCSWNHPGVNPFMGDVVAAVDRYRDIPVDVRDRLKARMAKREYDDLVSIRRDSIEGRGGYDYGNKISDMHFGTQQLCHSVSRAAWSPTLEERGLVYCESGHCILVPTVCRNVSRVSRKGVGNDVAAGPLLLGAPPVAGAEPLLAKNDLPSLEWFGPTGAGMPGTAGTAGPLGSGSGESIGSGIGNGAGSSTGTGGGFGGVVAGIPGAGGAGYPGVIASNGPSAAPGGVTDVPSVPPAAPIPEPQTWALLLVGLVVVASIAQRRRQRR